MDYHQLYLDLTAKFPDVTIQENQPLAPYTTLKIGGPADIFIHTKNGFQFKTILKYLSEVNNFSEHSEREQSEPEGIEHRKNSLTNQLTILGNGSNVLISDQGIRGIVIKNSAQKIDILSQANHLHDMISDIHAISAHRTENEPDKYLDFTKIDYDESSAPRVKVKMASGTPLPYAINYLLDQGITGLQWFAYIPGTIGGAVWYNLHGGTHHFSEFIEKITVFDLKSSTVKTLRSSDLSWDYDRSFFQQNPRLIILNTTFDLFKGDVARARQTAAAWIAQKVKVQPMNSAGSVFKNPPSEPCLKIWGEQKSTGWIIDHELGLKGTKIGGAQIGPQHANIFTNQGHATAADFLALVNLVKSKAKEKFNLDLEMEIKTLGDL